MGDAPVTTESDARAAVPTVAASALKPVLVAVDGSAHNLSAVGWAADEATRTGRPLLLLTATNDFLPPIPHFSVDDTFEFDGRIDALVKTLRDQLSTSHADTTILTTVRVGTPIGAILEAEENADVVVLGKRGLGAFARLIVGSTSIAVAGRSRLPAIIVPDTWDQHTHVGAPLVVGLDTDHYDDRVLTFAFERAHQLSVPLVAVHAWETHPVFAASPADQEAWAAQAVDALKDLVGPSQKAYPDVDLRIKQRHAHPAMALLDESESRNAQLIVLGRHTPSEHRGGFAIGSVTRAVLHYAECPVAVVG
jgi:nucleotide-binding universal stress UspA family protein